MTSSKRKKPQKTKQHVTHLRAIDRTLVLFRTLCRELELEEVVGEDNVWTCKSHYKEKKNNDSKNN